MKNKNVIIGYFVLTVVIAGLTLIPMGLAASPPDETHKVELVVPPYPEESPIWCGPAAAQMIMAGYPNTAAPCMIDQDEIWKAILDHKEEEEWYTDPEGLRGAMAKLCPPGNSWVVEKNTDPEKLMHWVAYWMTKYRYPVALLLETEPHNDHLDRTEHWVVIFEIETDKDPTKKGNTEIDLLRVSYYDPSPANLGADIERQDSFKGDWYNKFKPVTKPNSRYKDKYVAVIEPPQIVGRAVAPKEVLQGEPITAAKALKQAARWIQEYKLYEMEAYKDLEQAEPLNPLLVNKGYGGYYLIPYALKDKLKGENNVRFCLLINAYKGNLKQVAVTRPTKYMSEQKARQTALKYLGIKGAKKIESELVTKIEGRTFSRHFPAWKLTLDGKVVHVNQNGKIFTREKTVYNWQPKPGWFFGLHAGVTVPITDLGSRYEKSYMFGANLEYHLTRKISVAGLFGFNHFKAKPGSFFKDTHWLNFSANVKYEFTTGTTRPYVNGGFGVYLPNTGSVRPGYNVGAGFVQELKTNLSIQAGLDYHRILTDGEDPEFYTAHAGVLIRF